MNAPKPSRLDRGKMLDLVIISGASKGIGLNITKNLSHIAKRIVGIGYSDEIWKIDVPNAECELIRIQQNLADYNATYATMRDELLHIMYETPLKTSPNVGIVLCGAQLGNVGEGLDVDLELWDHLYKVNVLGNLAIIQACEELIESGKTRIVWFGGGGAASPFQFGGYAASKAAVVRTVENLGVEFEKKGYNASIIALAPGAVETDMLAKVKANGGNVKTKTDISEPTDFVRKFLIDEINSKGLNGRFMHVRDDLSIPLSNINADLFKLRRTQ